MASRLRGLLEKQLCEWSVGKTFTVLSACALLGLTIECEPGRAQVAANHPPVISTSSQWTLDAPMLASTNANGVPGNSFSLHANFSPDGTHLLFWSGSTNLVTGAGNGNEQLYIKDLTTGVVSLVSGDVNSTPGNGNSLNPNNSCQVLMFSPDGTKIVFESAATNLVLGGTNGNGQLFIKDFMTGAVTLVSADVNGVQGNSSSQNFAFSPDGTKVTFGSSATNLLTSATQTSDIFVKDLATGAVTLVSADANGGEGNGVSSLPVFSPDGMAVAFVSTSTNLAAGATNGKSEIYVKNLVSGAVALVSSDATGVPGDSTSLFPMFSPDGSKVAFNSISTNLAPGSASGNSEIYVKDLATGAITLVSTDANGVAANSSNSMLAVFSPDGTKIAFESGATNLVPGSTSGEQVFVKDLLTGGVTLASTDAGGAQGNSDSSDPNFSPDHKALAFQSMATNLGVTNGTFVIFVRPIFTSSGAVVDNPSATTLTTAGQLSFSDLDVADTHTASLAAQASNLGTLVANVSKDTTGTGTGGVISWNYQVGEAQLHALIAAATDTFTLTLTDSQGCTATTAIVVTDLPRDSNVVTAGNGSTSTSTSSCPTLAVTASPSDLTVTAGQTASFNSAASGTPAPNVQWQVSTDGGTTFNNVPGATSTTLTFAASLSQNGNRYQAVFTNLSGTATSSAATLTVNIAATTTALVSSPNPSVLGQGVAFTATVSAAAPGALTPTGTVTFLDGATSIGTGTLDSSGAALLSIPSLPVGAHSITASYAGDTNFTSSSSSPLPQIVNKDAATVTLNSSANPSVFGQGVTFMAMVAAAAPGAGTATGTVTFQDGSTTLGILNLVNGQASFTTSSLAVGSHSITTVYNGDSNFNAASSAAFSQTVSEDASSATLSSSPNPSVFGQPAAFTATLSAAAPGAGTPTGTVLFQEGSTSLGIANLLNGQASVTLSALGVGPHSVTAVYSGDGNFTGSTSAGLTQSVSQAATTTTLVSNLNPATYGQPVALTATVQSPAGTSATGSVTFLDGSTALGTASLSGNSAQLTTSALAAGTHSITAQYNGDTNFAGSTSTTLAETVNQAATVTAVASSQNPATFGQAATFTASVQPAAGSSATGTITFMDGSTSLGTVSLANNAAQFTVSSLALGPHSITAIYGGSANLAGSTSAAITETITQSSTSTTFTSGLNPATYGQAVTFVATVQLAFGGAATGSVTFFDGTNLLGTAQVVNNGIQHNSAQLTFSGFQGGAHSITATYSGDANYAGSTSTALVETVNPAASTVSVASSQNPATFGESVTLTATVQPTVSGSLASGTVNFLDGATSLGTVNLSNDSAQLTVSNLASGSHSITAAYSGDPNFLPSSSSLTQSVGASSSADLAINMTAEDLDVTRGDSDTYIIIVTNAGPSIASAVVMTDLLPAGTVFDSAYASSGSCSVPAVGQPITCTTASLSGLWGIFINVKITAPRGSTIANTANVTSSTPDPNLSNNTSSVTISVSRDRDGNEQQ